MDTKYFFYNIGRYNFGDSINNIFFKELLNDNTLEFKFIHDSYHYITTGSVLEMANEYSIVYGTGFISENSNLGTKSVTGKGTNLVIKKPYKIVSVRGKLTRNKLINMGIECPEFYGDPLLMFPILYNNFKIKQQNGIIGIIPHYIDKNEKSLKELITNLGENNIKLIDIILPDNNYKKFIDNILECEYIISSSLHGVMMGIIYKKKTIWIEFSNNVVGNKFKFYDFFSSLDITYNINNIYNLDILNNYINVDYDKLNILIKNMINIAPFIKNKTELYEKYLDFEKNYLIFKNK
jgi:pyruvyltransferase